MRRPLSVLLHLVVVAGMILSGVDLARPLPQPARDVLAATTGAAPGGAVSPELAGKRAKRKHERKQDRRQKQKQQKRKQERRHERARANRSQRHRHAPPGDPNQASGGSVVAPTAWKEFCSDPDLIQLPKSHECTHGSDPAPPGSNPSQPARPLSPRAASAAAAVTCAGDGQSGYRIQVLYVRASDRPDRYNDFLESIQAWAAEADQIFQESAEETGPTRNLRFVHDGGCQPIVDNVQVSPAGDGSFDATIAELKTRGYNQTDRNYLAFVDTVAGNICGIANIRDDDRADGAVNQNNFGPRYARVDARNGCWDGWIAAHEIMHNLGGVQDSAPNTSHGWHCIDEYDVMCYSDEPNHPDMRIDCANDLLDTTRFDCGNDDYYNTNPAAGSYLDRNWNPANNRFLIGAPDWPLPPTADTTMPEVHWVEPVGDEQTHSVSSGTVQLEAAASDAGTGVRRVEFWRYDAVLENWFLITSDLTSPYEGTLNVSALQSGHNTLAAQAYDFAGNSFYRTIDVNVVGSPPPDNEAPTVAWTSPVGNDQQHEVTAGQVALAATASDNVGVARVVFSRYDNSGGTWLPIGTDTAAPYTASIDVTPLGIGVHDLVADAFDAAGNTSHAVTHLSRIASVGPPPPPQPPVNNPPGRKHKKGKKGKKGKGKRR